MFDGSLPGPTAMGTVSDSVLVQSITGWAATASAAEARKLAAIAELHRRVVGGEFRERLAIDDTDAAAAHVSCALTLRHGKAVGLIDLAVTLRDRLPKVGARFLAGEISAGMIATIAWRTFLVGQAALAAIDTALAEHAPTWGNLSDAKLAQAIDVWIHRHDPDAVRRARNAMRGRYFNVGDYTDENTGTVTVHGRVSLADAALMQQRLAIMIATPCPDDPRTNDQRRADAVGAAMGLGVFFLACTCPDPDCAAKVDDGRASSITIHVIADSDSLHAEPDPQMHGDAPIEAAPAPPGPPAQPTPTAEPPQLSPSDPEPHPVPPERKPALIPGFNGAILPAPLLAELVLHGAKIRLVDTLNLKTEPRYKPSTALARFVRTRDMTCRFPGCDRPAVYSDLDHTQPWPAGSTHPANIKCYCRTHHLIKTFLPGWSDHQHPDGTLTVVTPAGLRYTTKPLTALLFPHWNTTTGPPPPPPPSHQASPSRPGRQLMMPTRRRTRAQNRAARVTAERTYNATQRALEQSARQATEAAAADQSFRRPGYGDDPPPF
ncbi:HNH endonuclease [Mycobacterium sp. SMC-8]|uniref:HNH endonuclease signature motif containing protein n=1 Tax=Mycobacterium sp. SMC-8 TaxID=2857060 RepID=UPI0021B49FE2|nr:HNH endonuclease signature motif containing protein [Mycobacterium sp. SMC-8]UXA10493.1 HNH endonuclease [Mycobacterium sp. SMC-8]